MKTVLTKLGNALLMVVALPLIGMAYGAARLGVAEKLQSGMDFLMLYAEWLGMTLPGLVAGWIALVFARVRIAWLVAAIVGGYFVQSYVYLHTRREQSSPTASERTFPSEPVAPSTPSLPSPSLAAFDPVDMNELREKLPADAPKEPQAENIAAFEGLMTKHLRDTLAGHVGMTEAAKMPFAIQTIRIAEGRRVLQKTVLDVGKGPSAARMVIIWGFHRGELRRVQCTYGGTSDYSGAGKCAAQVALTFDWPGWPASPAG